MTCHDPQPVSDVLVAVPAHDEAAEITRCLDHVVIAARKAHAQGIQVSVAVSAHRCVDDTSQRAARVLSAAGIRHLVVQDARSRTVGEVRARLVARARRVWGPEPANTWLFNTDADSHVDPSWIMETLRFAAEGNAAVVAGMVDLRGWSAPSSVRARYAALIESGMCPDGHTHVYGANLAIRLDAYLCVGGFVDGQAEDHELVDRLRGTGHGIGTNLAPLVRTSARRPGRAENGLGDLLERLHRLPVQPDALLSRQRCDQSQQGDDETDQYQTIDLAGRGGGA